MMQLFNFGVILIFTLINTCRSEDECLNADEDGSCIEHCPEGTFAYTPSCENVTMSQKTCRQPISRSLGYLCDYVRCDCPYHQYWDEAAKKCVALSDCADQSKVVD